MTGFVVELCGLPGSGKSTLARLVVEELAGRGAHSAIADVPLSATVSRASRIRRKGAYVAVQTARHPVRTTDAAWRIAASEQPTPRDAVAGLAQWLAVQQAIAAARDEHGVQLVEEGVVQTLWTVGLRARRDVVRPLLERLPADQHADLLVVVGAPIDVILERLAARPSRHSRTQRLTTAEQAAELRQGQTLMDMLTSWTQVPTVRMTNDGRTAMPELAGRVADLVCRTAATSPR